MTKLEHHETPRWFPRKVPRFVVEWAREALGDPNWGDPLNFLDQDEGVKFVIASSWLFCPETVEYRGGIFIKRRFSESNVDQWLSEHDIVSTQATVNLTAMWSLFVNADSPAFDDMDERELTAALGECWNGVLKQRYPQHNIVVSVDLDEEDQSSRGPSVTLWSSGYKEAHPA
ncbi:hypothetical protein HDA32_005591 [Spinactinospora alkalitolerans]|uniref:Uncharacterized protein n=1 Tax=Spinactinospora alkalitolerans TaxID=687207 RepID=A0A852U2U8_9ACTN|nr:hypothetical protein [Spinactinospora alkalitolerans]NYE50471.1 hypothetical protein [Spinactinospora alkalitolerans]